MRIVRSISYFSAADRGALGLQELMRMARIRLRVTLWMVLRQFRPSQKRL